MTMLEAGLRGGAITLALVLAVLGLRDRRRTPAGRYGVLFALCGIAYMIEAAPALAGQHSAWIYALRLLSVSSPGVFYLWASAHFDDSFVPSWRAWLPWFGMLVLAGWAMLANRALPWHVVQVAALTLVGAGVWRALSGRPGDLVEGRRQFRLVLAVGVAVFIGTLNVLSFVLNSDVAAATSLAGPAGLLALAFAAMLQLEPRQARDTVPEPAAAPAPLAATTRVAAAPAPLDPEGNALLARLRDLFETEKIYREEGLTVTLLATQLGIQEYRLRRLINQRLGHRNFNAFVNGFRLAEAEAALADPEQNRVPILTIALDTGFQSIGPFNRAFKTQFGVTPSEYRRDRQRPASPRAAE